MMLCSKIKIATKFTLPFGPLKVIYYSEEPGSDHPTRRQPVKDVSILSRSQRPGRLVITAASSLG